MVHDGEASQDRAWVGNNQICWQKSVAALQREETLGFFFTSLQLRHVFKAKQQSAML